MTARRLVLPIALCVIGTAAWLFLRSDRVRVAKAAQPPPAAAGPAPRQPPPADAVGPFYVGISSLDVEENERAGRLFESLSHELPTEPAVWADLGLARLRLGDLPGAESALAQAAKLAPGNGRVAVLQATVDEFQGQYANAIQRLQSLPDPGAAELYRLASLLGRTGAQADPPAQLRVLDRLRERVPDNLVVAFDRARLLARMENRALLDASLKAFDAQRAAWGAAAASQLDSINAAVAAGNFRTAATDLAFLQNLVTATPDYQTALAAVGAAGGSIGRPIREFLTYRTPETVVAPADESLAFEEKPDAALSAPPDLYQAAALSAARGETLLSLAGGRLRLADSAEFSVAAEPAPPAGPDSICTADFRGEGLLDVALVGGSGLKIWTQDRAGHFTAFTPNADVRSAFAQPAHGVWPIDFDADGDLDLLVARDGAAPQLFRNNGDGTFTALATFASFPEIREACWGDFDDDGNGDLAFLDNAGRVELSWNHRAGAFTAPEVLSPAPAAALACGDVTGRGDLGLVVLENSGVVRGFDFDRLKKSWSNRELARWSGAPDLAAAGHRRVHLAIADLDNNGAADLVASAGSTTAIWLNQGRGQFVKLTRAPSLFVTSIADLDGDGLLDLVGISDHGAAVAHTHGSKGYHWQSIQARARAAADGRINSFGIGGRVEIRAGPLLAMAPITAPSTHFGLGENPQVGVARIVWPNGVAQVEFSLQPDQQVTATQRLKGSCPWVFARNDHGFQFVKDFIWRSPLGMRINSQDTAGVDQTEDWILVPGRSLAVDHGAYELRITAELWETHFFDHVALKVVDHPASVATFVDERFVPAHPPKLAVIATTPPQPFAAAQDQSGRDVRPALAASDGDCVADFPLGRYQGIAADHWIEFQLPAAAPADAPLVVIGEGWIYPTDSSLNVAISQGDAPKPHGLTLEDFDPSRGWRAASDDLGFPAGKNKTVVIPIPRESLAAGRRRFRLRTNLEIYWDRLGWAVATPDARVKIMPAETLAADLRARGFSQLSPPERRKPDMPDHYARLTGTGPRWQDLEGFYTRYGDISELLRQTDDRYVIMNAGDEIVLRFAAPPSPPAGWTRDFVLVGDGWVKDGDFNTANSRTVQPLPFHGMHGYRSAPEALADDPVYQKHRDDWRRFHTRYVTAAEFERGLMHVAPARVAQASRLHPSHEQAGTPALLPGAKIAGRSQASAPNRKALAQADAGIDSP
ncbi:MAG TPA: FG-GAP-like repeat-containing protein [Opitutus sp.]|nr:FG-GAP-like repeat-containing protein [Opitutus sp.]